MKRKCQMPVMTLENAKGQTRDRRRSESTLMFVKEVDLRWMPDLITQDQ